MRIAYYAQISGAPSSGVMHKVRAQTQQWRSDGHEVRLFLLTRDAPGLWEDQIPYLTARRYADPLSRFGSMAHLAASIRTFSPDIIYQRYFAFYPTNVALPRSTPRVVEVNTDDRAEYALLGGFRNLYNQLTRRFVLGPAHAMVFVTSELSERLAFADFRAEHVVITNGVALDDYPELPAPANDHPTLVFVGSPGQPWQGFDKVVRLARLRPEWHFDIVGVSAEGPTPENIAWYGPMERAGVIRVLARADVGVGTLALHRKDLDEASPLKVREYLAVGLPVLYAYHDPDADVLRGGTLRITNAETNIEDEIDRITAFVKACMGTRVPRDAIPHVDYASKEAQRLSLFSRLLSG